MSDVVVKKNQTQRVSVNQSSKSVVGNTIFNPIRIINRREVNFSTLRNNVVASERTVKELDTTRMISGETPIPTPDGIETIFTVAHPYVLGSLKITRASLRLHPTIDYSETSSILGTFTMITAPSVDEPILVDYIRA